MRLAHGGHLSHGDPASITGRVYRFEHYGVRPDDERIDLDQVRELARSHRPKLLIAGGSSYPRVIDYAALRAIADEVDARLWVDMAHIAGLVAADVIPSPVPHADVVTCTTYKTLLGPHGGLILTTAELARRIDRAIFPGTQGAPAMSQIAAKAVCLGLAMGEPFRETQRRTVRLAASLALAMEARASGSSPAAPTRTWSWSMLRSRGITGDVAETALERIGILANRNMIPFDPETPAKTSGLRLGTPGLAVRGMDAHDAPGLAALIDAALGADPDESALRAEVAELVDRYPLP